MADTVCQCGDRRRPNINHRVRVPCWTYIGQVRYNVGTDGRVVVYSAPTRSTYSFAPGGQEA